MPAKKPSMSLPVVDVLRAIDRHHARINHVHVKDIRRPVVDGLDSSRHVGGGSR